MTVAEVWAPHDHFFSPRFTPPTALRVAPGDVLWLERPVRCTDPFPLAS
jgi:hypothetical protein